MRGRPAARSLGGCMSDAAAKVAGLPLLWLGKDFGRMDVAGA